MHNASFLPEDYLAQKAERRTNLICLTLFVVVMVAVFGAFLVTNRQWSQIRASKEYIDAQYRDAAVRIEELTELESQREQMLHKAELAAALVERVPRSVLLAELINRMPDRMSLLEFDLKSTLIKKIRETDRPRRSKRRGPRRARTRKDASIESEKIEAPRYKVELTLVGTAPTDLEVSRYMSELNAYKLLRAVTLKYSEEKEFDGRTMRKFQINLQLEPGADVRMLDAPTEPIKDPMSDELKFTVTGRERVRRGD